MQRGAEVQAVGCGWEPTRRRLVKSRRLRLARDALCASEADPELCPELVEQPRVGLHKEARRLHAEVLQLQSPTRAPRAKQANPNGIAAPDEAPWNVPRDGVDLTSTPSRVVFRGNQRGTLS